MVIWKSENPRCLIKLTCQFLKAWVTGDILEAVLKKLNHRLSRKILDNAGCHPEHLAGRFSSIKICYLPANTTSTLQPLDLGIIQNFKSTLSPSFLRYILSMIDECESASNVVKSVNISLSDGCYGMVPTNSRNNNFRKAGTLDGGLDVVNRGVEDDSDPFI